MLYIVHSYLSCTYSCKPRHSKPFVKKPVIRHIGMKGEPMLDFPKFVKYLVVSPLERHLLGAAPPRSF